MSGQNADTPSLSAQVNKLNIPNESSSSVQETEPSELVAVVDDLLNQLNSRFNAVSSEMLGKLDEMSKRLDALEGQIQIGNAAAASAAKRDSEDT